MPNIYHQKSVVKSQWSKVKHYGFTLIELLVVIAIVGTLSTVITVVFSSAQKNARDQQRKSDLAKIQVALEVYYSRYNVYPPNGSAEQSCDSSRGIATLPCSNASGTSWSTSGDLYIGLVGNTIIANLPVDPKNDSTYFYRYEPITSLNDDGGAGTCPSGWTSNKGCDYYLVAQLENDGTSDPYCVKGGKIAVTCPATL